MKVFWGCAICMCVLVLDRGPPERVRCKFEVGSDWLSAVTSRSGQQLQGGLGMRTAVVADVPARVAFGRGGIWEHKMVRLAESDLEKERGWVETSTPVFACGATL